MRDLSHSVVVALILTIIVVAVTTTPGDATTFAARTLDGRNNNLAHPAWGRAGTLYLRVAPANYADGISSMATGPSMRYVSNRVFNDVGQNIFSKDGVIQWGWVWGQFFDHDFGLREERSAENYPIGFDQDDPLAAYTNAQTIPSPSRRCRRFSRSSTTASSRPCPHLYPRMSVSRSRAASSARRSNTSPTRSSSPRSESGSSPIWVMTPR